MLFPARCESLVTVETYRGMNENYVTRYVRPTNGCKQPRLLHHDSLAEDTKIEGLRSENRALTDTNTQDAITMAGLTSDVTRLRQRNRPMPK
jgi:hypothetical protein